MPFSVGIQHNYRVVCGEYAGHSPHRLVERCVTLSTKRTFFGQPRADDRGPLSLLARAIIPERGVAFIELRLHAAAVAAERRHVAAAGLGGERQRLDFGAGAHRRPRAHDLHRPMHRALVELL